MPAGKRSSGDPLGYDRVQKRPLNENQKRRLRVTCTHIDHLLTEMENGLNESSSNAAFPTYISDLTAEQQRAVEEYIAGVRTLLMQALDAQGIFPGTPSIPLSRAVRSRLFSIDISAEEIRPRHMRGYGAISADAATGLSVFADAMQTRANELHRVVCGTDPGYGDGKEKRGPGRRTGQDGTA